MLAEQASELGSNSNAGIFAIKQYHYIPAHSSVKQVPGLVLHTGCVSLSANGSCGTSSTHTGNGRHSWYLLRAPFPGFRSFRCTGTSYLLSTQVPWPVQECAFALCVCVCMLHDYPFPSEGTCGQ